jgi:type IV secretory pathway TraG/TraD family ATPase VirD4
MDKLPAGLPGVAAGSDRPLGTATISDPAGVESRYVYKPGAIWLGRGPTGVPIGFADDKHVLVVGGTRGGKGTCFVINNLCLWPGSLVAIDPKGENATIAAPRRGSGGLHCTGMGQRVHVLDPFNVSQVADEYRSRFNPFDALDPNDDTTVEEAARLAAAIVVVHEESKDPFWDEKALDMVKCLILHILTAAKYEGRRNLVTLRDLVLRGDAEAVESLERQGVDPKDIEPAHRLLWQLVTMNPAFDGLVSALGHSMLNLLDNSNDSGQYESVLQVVQTNTTFIDSKGIKRCVEGSDFRLSDLKTDEKGVSLFLCLPQAYMTTHNRWLRMMIALITREMELVRGKPRTGYPLLTVLDEFAGLRRLRDIEDAAAQSAGHGIKLFLVMQNLVQMKAAYKDTWETFVSNAGVKLFFDIDDNTSRDYVSKLIGKMEVRRRVRSATDSNTKTKGKNEGQSTGEAKGKSGGTHEAKTITDSTGETNTSGGSYGETSTVSWKGPGGLFAEKHFSHSQSWSGSYSNSSTRSHSEGTTTGSSQGWSETQTVTLTKGTSESEAVGHTEGTAETIHVRDVLNPDEVGRFFMGLTDRRHGAFPGLALVLAGGETMIVRRTLYYEDYQFIARFHPHPDHAFNAPMKHAVNWASVKSLSLQEPEWRVTIGRGETVNRGDAIGFVSAVVSGKRQRIANVLAPVGGRVVDGIIEGQKYASPAEFITSVMAPAGVASLMMAMGEPGSTLSYPDGTEAGDPFAEVHAYIARRDKAGAAALAKFQWGLAQSAAANHKRGLDEEKARRRVAAIADRLRRDARRRLVRWAAGAVTALAVMALCGVFAWQAGWWSLWTSGAAAALIAAAVAGAGALRADGDRTRKDEALAWMAVEGTPEEAELRPYLPNEAAWADGRKMFGKK